MQLPDVNVLIYAIHQSSPHHRAAKAWIEDAFAGPQPVAFAWVVLLGFLRITTLKGALPSPLNVADALEVVNDWIYHPAARIIHPGERHAALLGRLLLGAGTGGNLTTDAHLAALAMEHGAELVTFDRDFERFSGLRVTVPG